MKKITLISCHPYEKSFNHLIINEIEKTIDKNQFEFELIDLIKDNFNPIMTKKDLELWGQGKFYDLMAEKYYDSLFASSIIILPFPIWWGTMPAILKGFFDKVLIPTKAYHYDVHGKMIGNLLNKKAIVIATMEMSKQTYNDSYKNPLNSHLNMITLQTCGIDDIKYFLFEKIASSTDEIRSKYINEITNYIKKL